MSVLFPPGSTIGIIGGGQLGRMMALAAAHMGYYCHIFSPSADDPAKQVTTRHTTAPYTDRQALEKFAATVDIVTYEFENIPHESVQHLARLVTVYPGPDVLRTCQHRILEKEFLRGIGIDTARFASIRKYEDLLFAPEATGIPAILKTAEMGYDGKGQARIDDAGELTDAWHQLGKPECVLEGVVDFTMELSVIVARNSFGQVATYPAVQNVHKHHILDLTVAPAPIAPETALRARAIAEKIAAGLHLVGVLAVEMFLTADQRLLVNELAPRPHNSGHWTIEAAATSQFEQAVRAVCGLPLGSAQQICAAEMKNLIGHDVEHWQELVKEPTSKLHLYGKTEAREGRKMGHVTRLYPGRPF